MLVALEPAFLDSGSNNANAETIAVDDASVYRVHLSVIASYPKGCSLEAGTCTPQALVNENPGPTCIHAIAVDDGGLYWVQATPGGTCKFSCGMYRTGKGGGSVTSLYVTSNACGNFIALDEDSVYTLSTINDELYFAARDGGGGTLTPVQSNPTAAPVVADGVAVYWLDNNTTGGGEIMKLLR